MREVRDLRNRIGQCEAEGHQRIEASDENGLEKVGDIDHWPNPRGNGVCLFPISFLNRPGVQFSVTFHEDVRATAVAMQRWNGTSCKRWAALCVSEMARLRPAKRLDRKSTRLNSSHRTISYAVFCL